MGLPSHLSKLVSCCQSVANSLETMERMDTVDTMDPIDRVDGFTTDFESVIRAFKPL